MDDEFQQCLQILLSVENNWDPSANIFYISEMQEERSYSVSRAQTISRNIRFLI